MKPNLDQGPDYERGFVDGMLYQTQTSVDKAVNAMAQPEQEPVATTYKEVTDAMNLLLNGDYKQVQMAQLMADAKLYTTPLQRPWVGLTDDELVQIGVATGLERAAAQMIESKLKEKNT